MLLALLRQSSFGDARAMGTLDWALILYLGLICTLAAYMLWTMALSHLDASRAVAYLYGVPALAVVIGAITLLSDNVRSAIESVANILP